MSVPVAADSAAVNVHGHLAAANYVDLRAERDVLAVLVKLSANAQSLQCLQLTPIRAIIWRPSRSGKP